GRTISCSHWCSDRRNEARRRLLKRTPRERDRTRPPRSAMQLQPPISPAPHAVVTILGLGKSALLALPLHIFSRPTRGLAERTRVSPAPESAGPRHLKSHSKG